MAKYWFNIWMLGILAAATCFAGCNEDTIREDFPEKEEITGNVYIRFRMNLDGNGIPGGTRAVSRAEEPREESPGTSHENAVNTIDLLVYDAGSDKLTDILSVGAEQIAQFRENPDHDFYVPVYAKKGQKVKIYAAVNLTERMRQQFHLGQSGNDVSLSSARNDYWEVIEEFVPGSAGKQETLENSNGCGIPMTGQFVIDGTGGKEIEITEGHTTKETALSVTADVSRIVAKVHVLTKQTKEFMLSTGEKVRYVHAEDKTSASEQSSGTDEDYSNWMGWIRLENVRYIPNATNKSTYLFPQSNDKENPSYPWKDLNMDLESYVVGGLDIDMGFDIPAWAEDYAFYNGLSLHKENVSVTSHLAQAEAYDTTKHANTLNGTDTDNRYTRGMYCLENYFDIPTSEAFSKYEEALPMVTHVSITARLTPRWIVVVKDYAEKMKKFIEGYSNRKEEFLGKYGLTTGDFTEKDVERWKKIYEYYENSTETDGKKKACFSGPDNLYRNTFRIIKTASEADAGDILNWSLKVNNLWSRNVGDFENGKYPDGTFYVYDVKYDNQQIAPNDIEWKQGYLYLTAGAVAAATDDNIDIKTYSVPHLGGWGYYYTYLYQYLYQLGRIQNKKIPYIASQVTRNTYYLITVGNFGMPGGSISRPEYIKVNTEPVGWDYDGKGDLNLH